MLMLRKGSQPDYRLCDMTVTVYHREGLTRTVYEKAFYEFTRQELTPAGEDGGEFLLVIPGKEQMIFPGDKVVLGIGPEITAWAQVNPLTQPTMSRIRQVRCRYFAGKMCHCEGK